MKTTMRLSDEILEVRKQLFQDYVNARERIKQASNKDALTLSQEQSSRLLAIARKQFRQREVEKNTAWFKRFSHNVQSYFHAIRLGNWGTFEDR